MSYKQEAIKNGMLYTVSDVPPWPMGIILGFQHFLTMLSATALIPLLLVPAMGGTAAQTAEVISTIFFVSGLNTLLQTTFGDRLPIIQGGSFAFLTPTFGIIFHPALQAITDDDVRFRTTMCVVQGAILVCGIVQVVLGYSGVLAYLVRFFSPVMIAPTVAMVGLGLHGAMNGNMAGCEWGWVVTVVSLITFSQLLSKIKIKIPGGGQLAIFGLFPVIWTILTAWFILGMVEVSGSLDVEFGKCKTKGDVIGLSLPAKFPYPGQWGAPIFRGFAIGPMVGAMIVSMVESIGDYYACAKLSGAPPPSGAVISRGLASEGWGLILCGLFGTGNGTTSYGENIGAISITRVGSRAVVQTGACIMLVVGLFPKIGALFVAMPDPITAGLYSCLFGLISASGLSLLSRVDLSSSRNLFILGFCLYNSLAFASGAGNSAQKGGSYFSRTDADGEYINPFGEDDEFFYTFFNNTMMMSLLCGLILDNLIPGTREERGCWEVGTTTNDEEFNSVYGLPWCLARVFKNCVYLDFIENKFKWPKMPAGGYASSKGDCCEMLCPCIPFFKTDSNPTVTSSKASSSSCSSSSASASSSSSTSSA